MTRIKFFHLTVVVLIFSSCTTTKPLTSKVQPKDVSDIQNFETLSFITLIEGGNRGKFNDTLSRKSKEIFLEVLTTFKSLPLTGNIFSSDTIVQKRIEREIEFLCVSADRQRSISGINLTPVLDSLLEISGKRFGLITITTGFTRTKRNYGGQVAKGAAMAIITLGMFYQTPIKANSTVYAMILDSKDNNVAFYRKSFLQDKEPLDKSVLTKQIQKLFEDYFWTRK